MQVELHLRLQTKIRIIDGFFGEFVGVIIGVAYGSALMLNNLSSIS